ncbi:integrase, catalytic region, zinc finger, CCHC-type containing protein [Tanacetum coccineum]|uniref:Integrase, catalytic region, zinc finger, CCHC-type containing protein n=1 Tax=Tanacetum coccineum TaxID=301880 RepID=A0ABQ5H0D4_9ASTR
MFLLLYKRNDEDNYVPPPVPTTLNDKDRVRVLEYAVKDGNSEQKAYISRELYTAISDRNRKIGSYEQSDIKGAFKKDVIPFSENLKETFKFFEKGFIAEIKEMKDIFKDKISENNKLRAQLKGKFSKSQMNQSGTSVNTKLSKPSTSGTKLFSVTPLPKSKVIPKVVEKMICLFKIETEPINAYFKYNRVVYRDYLKVTKEHVATLHELLEEARTLKPLDEHIGYAFKFAEQIQELLVVSPTNASGSKPRSNTKNDRIPQLPSRSKKNKVEAHHRKFKSSANKNNHVSNCNANVKNIALSKNSDTICLSYNECLKWIPTGRTFNLEGKPCRLLLLMTRLGHNLFSVRQSCDSALKVAYKKHTCFVQNLEGVDLLSGSRGSNLYTISMLDMMKSSLICLLSKALRTKYWLWHRRLSHLNFGTINRLAKQGLVKGLPKLKYTKDHLCSACQMEKSIKESHPHKPEPSTNEKHQMLHMDLCGPIQDIGKLQPKADIGIFIGYSPSKKAYQIYNIRTRQIMETMNVQFDELTQMASEQHGSGLDLHGFTSGHISLGLMLNQAASTSAKPPTKNDWDLLFLPMFDEYFKSPSAISTPISAATLLPSNTNRASSSTTIDYEAPSLSNSPNIEATNSPLNSINVETNEEVAEFNSDTFTNPFAPLESSSRIVDTSNMHTFQQPPIYTKKIDKRSSVYNNHRRSIKTSKEDPKNYKKAIEESCWIEAMQEEIHEFEWLEVWELVPRLDRAMIVSLKWIFKVKLDEYGRVLKNKARLVAKAYATQEYGSISDGCEDNISERDFKRRGYGFEKCDAVDIPMVGKLTLDEDPNGTLVDPTRYQGMVRSLMYLIASHPDLVFVVCMCARYQEKPTEKHLTIVDPTRYQGMVRSLCCQDSRKTTSGSAQFLGEKLILWMGSQLANYRFDYNKIPLYSDS